MPEIQELGPGGADHQERSQVRLHQLEGRKDELLWIRYQELVSRNMFYATGLRLSHSEGAGGGAQLSI